MIFFLLERQPLTGYLRIKVIAKELEISYYQLAKVAHILISVGIIRSSTGPKGGIILAKKADELTLAEIIKAFGESEIFDRCVIGLKECSDENPCPVHTGWKKAKSEIVDIFFTKTLSELQRDSVIPYFLK
ncbi:Rrf2 family transcriptional regulator [bacterium]|nr:Rrf2 family transcriptional regulator [bacterium]